MGRVTCAEVLKAEQEILDSTNFSNLNYVISGFIGTAHDPLAVDESDAIRALRLAAFAGNPRIKFAFVVQGENTRAAVTSAFPDGDAGATNQVFKTFEEAAQWVGL
jgi:hypothetical protein